LHLEASCDKSGIREIFSNSPYVFGHVKIYLGQLISFFK
jgi:hypothetical protein